MTTNKTVSVLVLTLFCSVLLNLLLVGGVFGLHVPPHPHPFAPLALAAPHGEWTLGWMARHLDSADAVLLKSVYEDEAPALQKGHADFHAALAGVAEAFPKDAASLHGALQTLETSRDELFEANARFLQRLQAKLSPDGRARLAALAEHRK